MPATLALHRGADGRDFVPGSTVASVATVVAPFRGRAACTSQGRARGPSCDAPDALAHAVRTLASHWPRSHTRPPPSESRGPHARRRSPCPLRAPRIDCAP
eukprot:5155083-Prymnesium_polylepis.1